MTINEKFVKLGKFPVTETIPVDGTFQIRVVGHEEVYYFECVKVEQKSNQDGSYDEVYVLKYVPH